MLYKTSLMKTMKSYRSVMKNLSTVREGNTPASALSFNLKDILIKTGTKSCFLSTKEELNLQYNVKGYFASKS